MSNRNKGFDPLSSLFEAPDPARGVPLPEVEDGELPDVGGQVEMTDPLFKHPPPPVEADEHDISVDESPEQLARRLAREALAKAGAVSNAAPQRPAEEDKVALAQRLAREALARANAQTAPAGADTAPDAAPASAAAPAAPDDAEDKQALARRLAQEALARAAAAAPPPAGEDKQALARRLAQEALAKAQQAAAPATEAAPQAPAAADVGPDLAAAQDKVALARRVAAEAQRQAAAAPPPKKSRKQAQQSRVSALTQRARKPVSALDAARAAARDEEERQAQAIRKEANQLRDVVQELIPEWLPGISAVFVANAIAVDKREVLVALWKGHRAKFLSDGQLERAVGAAAVLSALDQIPEGMLVAAHAVTDASDYLVWLDLDKRALVAAFSDARAYFAG